MSQWQQPPQYGQQQQWPPQYQQHYHQTPLKHSGLGIASFIISILAFLLAFAMVFLAGALESSTPGGLDEDSREATIIGLAILLAGTLAFVGAILGIVGCCLPDRSRIFAILGTVFNALVVLGLFGLIVIGLAIG